MNDKVTIHPPAELSLPDLAEFDDETLERMLAAGAEINECYRVLRKFNANIVGELLKGQGDFIQLNHYPKGDVFDPETFSQYYYHSHRGIPGEHGHFHTFMRAGGMHQGVEPVPYDGDVEWPRGKDALAHLVSISMDKQGYPIGLFATNRWVTAEAWYKAEDVIGMIDGFLMDHAYPSWPVNRWISAMFELFRPQIESLIRHRDPEIEQWQKDHPDVDVFEDRTLELTGYIYISVDKQLEKVRAAMD